MSQNIDNNLIHHDKHSKFHKGEGKYLNEEFNTLSLNQQGQVQGQGLGQTGSILTNENISSNLIQHQQPGHEHKMTQDTKIFTESMPITKQVPVVEYVSQTRTIPIQKEIEVMKNVPVQREVQYTENVATKTMESVTENVEVTKTVPVTKNVQYIENVNVTSQVPVTRMKEVTKTVPVTKTHQVVEQVPVRTMVDVTENVQVTRNVPVQKTKQVIENVSVTSSVPVTENVTVTKSVPVTKHVEVTEHVPITRMVADNNNTNLLFNVSGMGVGQTYLHQGISTTTTQVGHSHILPGATAIGSNNIVADFRGVPGCKRCSGNGYRRSRKHSHLKACRTCVKATGHCGVCSNTGIRIDDAKKCNCYYAK
jgi:hypothetical protein